MRTSNEEKVYGYDGKLPLTKSNWKCASCVKFSVLTKPCFTGYAEPVKKFKTLFPDVHLEPTDNCPHYNIIKNDSLTLTDVLDNNAEKLKYIEEHKDEMIGDNLFVTENNSVEQEYNVDENEYNEFKNNFIQSNNNLHNALVSAFDNGEDYSVNLDIPNIIEVKAEAMNGKIFTATVQLEPTWDKQMKEIAIDKAKSELDKQIAVENAIFARECEAANTNAENEESEISEDDKNTLRATRDLIDKYLSHDKQDVATENVSIEPTNEQEQTLEGDIHIGWFNQSTSWLRVVNAARRTIGKKPLNKEPSDSWKAKILLAEHSPIRLLEYDWGWEKIRQWVSVHLVRHHVGVEKFVHSQRSDRRELPCDRDHLYQGARNDMDMTANAQGLINMSRKRCCNCASPETREAWKLVLDELEKKDPVMRAKCVRECVYRGFCPEWMSKCGYYKTDAFKRERADYVNTLYGNDAKYYYHPVTRYVVSNTGKVYKYKHHISNCPGGIINLSDYNILPKDLIEIEYEKEWINGRYDIKIKDYNCSVDKLVFNSFNSENKTANEHEILHIDGNEWNNNINNLKLVTE